MGAIGLSWLAIISVEVSQAVYAAYPKSGRVAQLNVLAVEARAAGYRV